ncbi:restriction endonuclease type II-like protein [Multifurca ochricompacta]|uniref:Restriction endonuclease type II-like protein n=1 Tax=Multifurca ochricompacta TaxID=376703 RepID=A0AAD4LYE9_9AGAM|nr:restriction endonuclease type II-like protein [Multifurca ochricompacta]
MEAIAHKGKHQHQQRQPPVVQPSLGNSIIINPCQRLNPIIECIRNVPKEFGDILPDYQVGKTTGVLFLSLRYHRLHPEYIHQRIERLGQSYNLRILLLMCDISEHRDPIRELTRICLLNNITVIVTWSTDEAGQYLTAYKQSEHRSPTLIRERVDKTPSAIFRAALTSIPRVNKTDVETLRTSFGSFARIAQVDSAQLARLPGFGPKKVARLKDAFERPFRTGASTSGALTQPVTNVTERTSNEPVDNSVWDIQLDLNTPSPSPSPSPLPELGRLLELDQGPSSSSSLSKRVREESPIWEIEGDDDVTFPEEQGEEGGGGGGGTNLSWNVDPDLDEDIDMDIAPALRAKRRRA